MGSAPNLFSPLVPGNAHKTSTAGTPRYGTKHKKIHQPDKLRSCSLLTVTVKRGISVASQKRNINAANKKRNVITDTPMIAVSRRPSKMVKTIQRRTNHQNSARLARPLNVKYLERHASTAAKGPIFHSPKDACQHLAVTARNISRLITSSKPSTVASLGSKNGECRQATMNWSKPHCAVPRHVARNVHFGY